MRIRIFLLLFTLSFFLQGCIKKPYLRQNPVFIVFKTPAFKYADMGFIYENADEVKVEIYDSGQPLVRLRMTEQSVCFSLLECMSKTEFNRQVLSSRYPKDILTQIFRGKYIFNAEGLKQSRNGFTQKMIKENKYHINYTVLKKQIVFHDKINNILIKVKKI